MKHAHSDDELKIISAQVKKLDDLASGKTTACPICGATVIRMTQSGRDVYLEPCGHRLWQGLVPNYWRDK